jgi:glucose-1-phosphate thymidylyltransferase
MRATRGLILSSSASVSNCWPLGCLRRELAPVANNALLMLELRALDGAGVREIGIVGDSALWEAATELVAEGGLEAQIVHIAQPADAGPGRRLLAAQPFVGDRPFIAELGGSLTEHDRRRSVEVLVRRRLRAVVVLAADRSRTPEVVPLRRSDRRTAPNGASFAENILAGANTFVFTSEIFDATRAAIEAHGGEEIEIADAVTALAETHGQVEAVLATGWSKRIEGVEDLLEINRLVLGKMQARPLSEKFAGSRILGPAAIDESATIESSVLVGPLAIARDAHIKDSYIGPYSAIGSAGRVDGAEIEQSLVLPAASISNVGVRIAGSVIGSSARITRDLAPPRALRLWVGPDAHVSLA